MREDFVWLVEQVSDDERVHEIGDPEDGHGGEENPGAEGNVFDDILGIRETLLPLTLCLLHHTIISNNHVPSHL